MDISTLANLINAIAVTAGVIFAAAQIRDYRRRRRRDAMLNLVRSFQSPTFARALRLVIELPDNTSADGFARSSGARAKISSCISPRLGKRSGCSFFTASSPSTSSTISLAARF